MAIAEMFGFLVAIFLIAIFLVAALEFFTTGDMPMFTICVISAVCAVVVTVVMGFALVSSNT